MNIYNEIVWQWDEKTQKMIEVSSDSFEYDGPVDKLYGGSGGNGDGQSGDESSNNPELAFNPPNISDPKYDEWVTANYPKYKNALIKKISSLIVDSMAEINEATGNSGLEWIQKTVVGGKVKTGRNNQDIMITFENEKDIDNNDIFFDHIAAWGNYAPIDSYEVHFITTADTQSENNTILQHIEIVASNEKPPLNLNTLANELGMEQLPLTNLLSQYFSLEQSKTLIDQSKASEFIDTEFSELIPNTFTTMIEKYQRAKNDLPFFRYRIDDFYDELRQNDTSVPLQYKLQRFFEDFESIKEDIPSGRSGFDAVTVQAQGTSLNLYEGEIGTNLMPRSLTIVDKNGIEQRIYEERDGRGHRITVFDRNTFANGLWNGVVKIDLTIDTYKDVIEEVETRRNRLADIIENVREDETISDLPLIDENDLIVITSFDSVSYNERLKTAIKSIGGTDPKTTIVLDEDESIINILGQEQGEDLRLISEWFFNPGYDVGSTDDFGETPVSIATKPGHVILTNLGNFGNEFLDIPFPGDEVADDGGQGYEDGERHGERTFRYATHPGDAIEQGYSPNGEQIWFDYTDVGFTSPGSVVNNRVTVFPLEGIPGTSEWSREFFDYDWDPGEDREISDSIWDKIEQKNAVAFDSNWNNGNYYRVGVQRLKPNTKYTFSIVVGTKLSITWDLNEGIYDGYLTKYVDEFPAFRIWVPTLDAQGGNYPPSQPTTYPFQYLTDNHYGYDYKEAGGTVISRYDNLGVGIDEGEMNGYEQNWGDDDIVWAKKIITIQTPPDFEEPFANYDRYAAYWYIGWGQPGDYCEGGDGENDDNLFGVCSWPSYDGDGYSDNDPNKTTWGCTNDDGPYENPNGDSYGEICPMENDELFFLTDIEVYEGDGVAIWESLNDGQGGNPNNDIDYQIYQEAVDGISIGNYLAGLSATNPSVRDTFYKPTRFEDRGPAKAHMTALSNNITWMYTSARGYTPLFNGVGCDRFQNYQSIGTMDNFAFDSIPALYGGLDPYYHTNQPDNNVGGYIYNAFIPKTAARTNVGTLGEIGGLALNGSQDQFDPFFGGNTPGTGVGELASGFTDITIMMRIFPTKINTKPGNSILINKGSDWELALCGSVGNHGGGELACEPNELLWAIRLTNQSGDSDPTWAWMGTDFVVPTNKWTHISLSFGQRHLDPDELRAAPQGTFELEDNSYVRVHIDGQLLEYPSATSDFVRTGPDGKKGYIKEGNVAGSGEAYTSPADYKNLESNPIGSSHRQRWTFDTLNNRRYVGRNGMALSIGARLDINRTGVGSGAENSIPGHLEPSSLLSNCSIDDVKIFGRALSNFMINKIANTGYTEFTNTKFRTPYSLIGSKILGTYNGTEKNTNNGLVTEDTIAKVSRFWPYDAEFSNYENLTSGYLISELQNFSNEDIPVYTSSEVNSLKIAVESLKDELNENKLLLQNKDQQIISLESSLEEISTQGEFHGDCMNILVDDLTTNTGFSCIDTITNPDVEGHVTAVCDDGMNILLYCQPGGNHPACQGRSEYPYGGPISGQDACIGA